jgi:hypothetical protein
MVRVVCALRVKAPRECRSLVDELLRLPRPGRYEALVVRLQTDEQLAEFERWREADGESTPVAVVLDLGSPASLELLRLGRPIDLVITSDELVNNRVPAERLDELMGRTIMRRLLSVAERLWPSASWDPRLRVALLEVGSRGGGRAALRVHTERSRRQIEHWCETCGIPAPGTSLRIVRYLAAELRRSLGMRPELIVRRGGWPSRKAYEEWRRRFRKNRELGGWIRRVEHAIRTPSAPGQQNRGAM